MISTIVAIIVTFIPGCTMKVIIITVGNNASISIPAQILLLSLLLLVRYQAVHNDQDFYYHDF